MWLKLVNICKCLEQYLSCISLTIIIVIINIIYIIKLFISLLPNNIPSRYKLCNYLLLSTYMVPRNI